LASFRKFFMEKRVLQRIGLRLTNLYTATFQRRVFSMS